MRTMQRPDSLSSDSKVCREDGMVTSSEVETQKSDIREMCDKDGFGSLSDDLGVQRVMGTAYKQQLPQAPRY
jgi:hypothetical protein